MKDIFQVQPASCRAPLPFKKIEYSDWAIEKGYDTKWNRVLVFDPYEVYQLSMQTIDPYKRLQWTSITTMFPSIKGLCACGCGGVLRKGRRRWASNECGSFAYAIRCIICNTHQVPGFYIEKYYGSNDCAKCGESGCHELDHIIGVKHGGGGCWLSNYQYLCKKCHREKTNEDFGWNKKPRILQMKLDL